MDTCKSLPAEKRKIIEAVSNEGMCKRAKAECQQGILEDADNAFNLLHLSDDVLLNIFSFCSPTDIKALSNCNHRLNILCSDRSLWKRVDLRDRRMGVKALSLYVRTLPKNTTQALCVRGLIGRPAAYNNPNKKKNEDDSLQMKSKSAGGDKNSLNVKEEMKSEKCQSDNVMPTCGHFGYMPTPRKESQDPQPSTSGSNTDNNEVETCGDNGRMPDPYNIVKESGNSSPKPFSPSYDSHIPSSNPSSSGVNSGIDKKSNSSKNLTSTRPANPEIDEDWTVTKELMTVIKKKCPALKELRLEYCYIDCNAIQSNSFPPTLETLSLKGSFCRNIPLSRTYLFRLHEHCPRLTEIDLSRCNWLASHSLLVLSKVPSLKRLSLRHCLGLGECVAYASLSARYGFKSLEVLDIRGTPMGDSEITAFSLIGSLRELLLQGSGVVEDSMLCGTVGGYTATSPQLRKKNDNGNLLDWELQDPYQGDEEWSESDGEDVESEVPNEEARRTDQNAGDPANPHVQMGGEGVDPFEAVGRVHVIYVDVHRAPHNNMLRVRYAPMNHPQPGENQAQQNERQDEGQPQPDIEVQIPNLAARGDGNAFPEVVIHRENDNRINLRVQYDNNDANLQPHHDVDQEELQQNQEAPPARGNARERLQHILNHIEQHERDYRLNLFQGNNQDQNQPVPEGNLGNNRRRSRRIMARANRDNADGLGQPGGNDNQAENNVEPANNENNQNEDHPAGAPRQLYRPGEFLRRGPAFAMYPQDPEAHRLLQQQQVQVAHRRDVVPMLLYDFRHTMRQLESYVGRFRTTDRYERYVRRVHFFRRMLQQIYNNEPIFNTNRAIPEQPLPAQRDIVGIGHFIERTCHHLERLIARAIQYPADGVPFRINYNYIDIPDYVDELGEDENDSTMRPETVEFHIQQYFGVPPAEEVNMDMENAENLEQPQPLNDQPRIINRNVPAPEEIFDIVHNIHNVLNHRGENVRNINIPIEALNLAPHHQNEEAQQAGGQDDPGAQNEPGRMVNIRNINIEIREHNVQVPLLPVPGGDQREHNIAAQRQIDERIERVIHDEIRLMQQDQEHWRPRNVHRLHGHGEFGPFVIRGDVMEERGRRRRRVVHIPLQLNVRGAQQHNEVNYVGATNLVTDASLLRFGLSKNVVHIGGDGPPQQQSGSHGGQLTTLVCRGYPRVTDRALSHLAVAAPKLTHLDLSHTGVTHAGAQAFRAARQDCELIVEHLQDNGEDSF